MLNIFLLLLVYAVILVFLTKKPGAALCYVLMFTPLNNMVLRNVGMIEYRFISGILVLLLFLFLYFRPKSIYANISSNMQSTAFWGVMLLPAIMAFHIYVISEVSNSGLEYSYSFIFNTMLYFLAIIVLVYNKSLFDQFVDGITYFGIIFFIIFYLTFDMSMIDVYDRSTFRDADAFNAITLGRLCGVFLIAGLFQLLNTDKKHIKILSIVLALISTYWILVTSTRQIIIGLFCVIFIYYIIALRHSQKAVLYLSFGLLFSIFAFTYLVDIQQFAVLDRMHSLVYIRDMPRFYDYIVTFDILRSNVLVGVGPHGYQDIMFRYPHSYLLEMTANFGLLGIVSFSMVVITGSYYSIKLLTSGSSNYKNHIIALLWIFYLISVMISGDININRHFWLITGVLISAHNLNKIVTINIFNANNNKF